MPVPIDYAVLIATQAIKTEVLADILHEIGELEYNFQTKKRAYERIGERRDKAVSDLAIAIPRIADLQAAIAILPNGPIKSDLVEELTILEARKLRAEATLAVSNEAATVLAYEELDALFIQIGALGSSLTDIGGVMPLT